MVAGINCSNVGVEPTKLGRWGGLQVAKVMSNGGRGMVGKWAMGNRQGGKVCVWRVGCVYAAGEAGVGQVHNHPCVGTGWGWGGAGMGQVGQAVCGGVGRCVVVRWHWVQGKWNLRTAMVAN